MAGATLVIRILADAKQAQQTMDRAASKSGQFAGKLGKLALPAAGVLTGLGAMGKAAADDARGQAVLARTLAKTTGATDKQIASSEAWISQVAAATGVADDQLRPALGKLAMATGDVGMSQDAMRVALDVAAATGKDVTTVAGAMAKGYGGNTSALGRLVPGLDKAALKSKDMKRVMADLAKKTGGTAAKAADTAAGKMQRAAVAMDEAQETAGTALLPVMETLAGVLSTVAGWAQRNQGAMKALVLIIGGLAGAILVLNAALKAYQVVATAIRVATQLWRLAQLQLNLAFLTNPIFLIIAIIVALVAAIVIAYKKSATFRKIVQGAWAGIKKAIAVVWAFLKTYVFAPLIAYYKRLWEAVKLAVKFVIAYWQRMWTVVKTIYGKIKKYVIDPIVKAFDAVADGIAAAFKTVIDWIKDVIDWIKKIKIPKPVQWLIDKGKAVFSSSPPPPAATTPPAPGARTTTPRSTAGDRRSPGGEALMVNVILDGRRVGGYVDRVITRRLDLEGARAAAGSWS